MQFGATEGVIRPTVSPADVCDSGPLVSTGVQGVELSL